MKTIQFLLLLSLFTLLSCKKTTSDIDPQNPQNNSISVEYRISATNADEIWMNYFDDDQITQGGSCISGWSIQFNTTKKPYTAYLKANALNLTGGSMSLTIKILINGTTVKQSTVSGNSSVDKDIQYLYQ